MKKITIFTLITYFLISCTQSGDKNNDVLNQWVDPYIGTGGHGHTFMGVATPFGAIQLGPENINKGWDWCSGYHYSDSVIIGFSHLHLSGTGCVDSGDIIFMPYTGPLKTQRGTQDSPSSGYGSYYSHANEVAEVGYYSVKLEDYDIKAELTASERVGFHKYTYPAGKGNRQIMINLKEANGDDRIIESYLEQINDSTLRGYRHSTGWSKGVQQVYFTAAFSQPVQLQLYDDQQPVDGKKLTSLGVRGNAILAENTKEVMVKVAISPVSMENAQENLQKEIPHWDFNKTVKETKNKWESELSKIKIETDDIAAKRIFYTSMYHAFLQPVLFNDCSNDYRGADRQIYSNATFQNYTVFSLWDTYRAAHPLYTIVQPERVSDFVKSMLAIYEQKGLLPVWHLYGSDTFEMIGIQSVPVIADAILKGFNTFNHEQAYNAMKQSMLSNYKGLKYVREMEYIPADLENESVAKGLEYAIADWALAQVAKKLDKEEDYKLFSKRASYYRHYWDKGTRFFRGRNMDNSWTADFNPFHSKHRADDYCEGNAWQYLWLVPHDIDGLVGLFGGVDPFVEKLDSLFILNESMGEEVSPDISGLIGQYAHGNEPGHHIPYIYSLVGQQWKSAKLVRTILREMYHDKPDGLQGNEDCGQMSSWYIFSSLGFYPVNPSDGIYVLGAPLFDKASIRLNDDKTFDIKAYNNTPENNYIQSATLNGKPYNKPYITHNDITNGGELIITLGKEPNTEFGTIK